MTTINPLNLFSRATVLSACVLSVCVLTLSANRALAAQKVLPQAKAWYQGEGPGSIENGTGTRFGSSQWGFEIPYEKKIKKNERYQSKVHLDWTEFEWQGTSAAQDEYIWLSVPIQYQQQRGRKHQFLLNFEPGLMTDGGNIGFDHIGLNGSVIGRSLRRKGGYWQYGVIVDRSFGDYDARPVIGVGWQASKRTWVDLGFPRTDVRHKLSHTVQSFFRIKPAGGVWRHGIEGQSKDYNLHYTNWQIGVGVDFNWRKAMWLSAELGQLRKRQIRGFAAGADAATAPSKVKATPGMDRYWRLGAEIRF